MVEDSIDGLVKRLSALPHVEAIGLSSNPLPRHKNDGDIDLFIYCSSVPEVRERIERYPAELKTVTTFKPGVFKNDTWGDADYTEIDGIETWLMYFNTIDVARHYEEIRQGIRAERDNGFYPTGRLAMFENMTILHEKGSFLRDLKDGLAPYPAALKKRILESSIELMMDEEDLARACERNDVLFFHVSIDTALDAILQFLFALNEQLFPSRKRNIAYLESFKTTPRDTVKRMKNIIRLGSSERTLQKGFDEFKKLRKECLGLSEIGVQQ